MPIPIRIRKYLGAFCLIGSFLWAEPTIISHNNAQIISTNGIITHISTFGNHIFVGNASGEIDVFEIKSNRKAYKAYSLTLPPIKDYIGNTYKPRIFDIATFDGQTLFVLSESSLGNKEILKISATHKPEIIFQTTSSPKRIISFQKDKLIIGFLSNEIGLFDINNGQLIYTTHLSQASFSDLCLNMPFIFSTEESGIVNVLDAKSGKILAKIDNINKDNNYQVVSSQNIILTAGADRQMGIYTFNKQNEQTVFKLQNATSIRSEFIVYSVGISPEAKWAGANKNEGNDISIFTLPTLQEKYILKGLNSRVNNIIFYDENTIIAAGDDKNFIIWTL